MMRHKFLISVTAVLFIFFATAAFGQKGGLPGTYQYYLDRAIAGKAQNLSLSSDKDLLDPGEVTSLHIKIVIASESDDTTVPSEVNLPDGADSPYKATNWRILEGGGNLVGIDDTTQSYTAPKTAPKTITIAVDLSPRKPLYTKVTLLHTLYCTDNDNSFYLKVPGAGIPGNKYVSKTTGGGSVPTPQGIDPKTLKNLPAAAQAQLKKAQAEMAGMEALNGVNAVALTSNAMAYFDIHDGFTAIKIDMLVQEMANGKASSAPIVGRGAILSFKYEGHGPGTYKMDKKTTGLGFLMGGRGFGCGVESLADKQDYPCRGQVVIEKMDDKTIEGRVRVTVFVSAGDKVKSGTFSGKFKANRAN